MFEFFAPRAHNILNFDPVHFLGLNIGLFFLKILLEVQNLLFKLDGDGVLFHLEVSYDLLLEQELAVLDLGVLVHFLNPIG